MASATGGDSPAAASCPTDAAPQDAAAAPGHNLRHLHRRGCSEAPGASEGLAMVSESVVLGELDPLAHDVRSGGNGSSLPVGTSAVRRRKWYYDVVFEYCSRQHSYCALILAPIDSVFRF